MKRLNEKGFTLIELLIVIGIIGILSVIAIPNFMRFQAKAKQTEAKLMLSGLYTAEKAFFAEYNGYTNGLVSVGYAPDGAKRYFSVGFLNTCGAGTGTPWIPAGAPANSPAPALPGAVATGGGVTGFTGWDAASPQVAEATTVASRGRLTEVNIGNAAIVLPSSTAPENFTAGACGYLRSDTLAGTDPVDVWTITEGRVLANNQNGT